MSDVEEMDAGALGEADALARVAVDPDLVVPVFSRPLARFLRRRALLSVKASSVQVLP